MRKYYGSVHATDQCWQQVPNIEIKKNNVIRDCAPHYWFQQAIMATRTTKKEVFERREGVNRMGRQHLNWTEQNGSEGHWNQNITLILSN